ncbi:MAG: hypothetical protein GF335_01080 [Candidatus Moranbacteria bacterium]|nr:hypothetical protein [Candidatus Moranbacteria bacterium]
MNDLSRSRRDLKNRSGQRPIDPAYRPANTNSGTDGYNQQGPYGGQEQGASGLSNPNFNAPGNYNTPTQNQNTGYQNYPNQPGQPQGGQGGQGGYDDGDYNFPNLEDPGGEDNEIKKVVIAGIVIIVIMVVVSLGLYFYSRGRETPAEVEPQSSPSPQSSPGASPVNISPSPSPTQSVQIPQDTPTHKHVVLWEEVNLEEQLQGYIPQVKEIGEPVRFTFYRDNQELDFLEFSEAFGLNISQDIKEISTSSFYFLLTPPPPEENEIGSVLIINSIFADQNKTLERMKGWEINMVQGLRNLILFNAPQDLNIDSSQTQFNDSSSFSGGRYINLTSDNSRSLNYIVINDKVVIANTFNSFGKGIGFVRERQQ